MPRAPATATRLGMPIWHIPLPSPGASRPLIFGAVRPWLVTALVILGLPLLLAWPLPLVWRDAVLAAPGEEAASHIWGLWAAWETGHPLVVDSPLLGWPDGLSIVLVDPVNLPAFGLGLPFGPAAAYNALIYVGLALVGLAGAALARRVGGAPWLGAVAAMAAPVMVSTPASGLTEELTVGLVGLFLAALLRALDGGGPSWTAAAAALLALSWYGGPYNGLFASAIGAVVGLRALVSRRGGGRAALIGIGGAVLTAPLAWAILTQRDPRLPGSSERAGLPGVQDWSEQFRGGIFTGADLLDPFLPAPLTGGEPAVSHTAYLGVVVLAAAIIAVARDRRRWPWLAGAAVLVALALGPHLYLQGHAIEVGGRPLLGPAGGLILALPFFGRVTRWYRAAAIAGLLLAPLVSLAGRRRGWGVAVAIGLVLDTLLLAPLEWPLHATPLPQAPDPALLDGEGALLEFPMQTNDPPPGKWRDRGALGQTLHGHPIGGTIMGLPLAEPTREVGRVTRGLVYQGALPEAERAELLDNGFRWLVVYPEHRSIPSEAPDRLEGCLGAPLETKSDLWVYDLGGRGAGGCGP